MAFTVNSPPANVFTTTDPSSKELGQRSLNQQPVRLNKRRSLDGRRFLPTLNEFPFDLNTTRNILADKFPTGINAEVDAAQSPNTTSAAAPPSPISFDNPAFNASVNVSGHPTIISPLRYATVPSNNPGQVFLQLESTGPNAFYSINGNTPIPFDTNIIITLNNGDSLQFSGSGFYPQSSLSITLLDNSNNQHIGSCYLVNLHPESGL